MMLAAVGDGLIFFMGNYTWLNKGIRCMYWRYYKQALRRGYTFELSKDLFTKLVTSDFCFYCGVNSYQTSYGTIVIGIDRKNNHIGYTEQNCVPCCKDCNYKKGTRDLIDFIKILENV